MKTGTRLYSQVCGGEVIVVRAENATAPLLCGGLPMREAASDDDRSAVHVGHEGGFLLGKRYDVEVDGQRVEVLATRAGDGALSFAGTMLGAKAAKALPASD